MPTPKQIQAQLDKFFTEVNLNSTALSEFSSEATNVRVRRLSNLYNRRVLAAVNKLSVDKTGRITNSKGNAKILRSIRNLGEKFVEGIKELPAEQRAIVSELSKSVKNVNKQVKNLVKLANIAPEISAIESTINAGVSNVKSATSYQSLTRSFKAMTTNTVEGISSAVFDAITTYGDTKDSLSRILFGNDTIPNIQKDLKRLDRKLAVIEKDVNGYIAEVRKGRLDMKEANVKLKKNMETFKADRKKQIDKLRIQRSNGTKGAQPLANNDQLANKIKNMNTKKLMDAQQSGMQEKASKTYGKKAEIVYVNAKNTDYDDNCFDAAESEPMTLTEWESSSFGPPRSDRRDCTVNCKCLLYAVGTKNDDLPAITGEDISDV